MPLEKVEYKLRYITTRRYEDYSIDIIGKFEKNGKFHLTNKFGLTNVSWIENRRAYLEGRVRNLNEGAQIEIKLRPNKVLIILFYISILLFFGALAGLRIPFLSRLSALTIILIFSLILLITMFVFTNALKKRFERLMQLSKA
jgi:hypothetical protein